MKNKIQNKIFEVAHIFEIIISVIVVVAIIISFTSIPHQIEQLYSNRIDKESLRNFLGYLFNIVIGIEFLRMLSKHTYSSLIEVLIFAIARELVVEITSPIENFIIIIEITILFITKKYLLNETLEK